MYSDERDATGILQEQWENHRSGIGQYSGRGLSDEEKNDTVKLNTKQQESAVEIEDLATENSVDKSEHAGANSKKEKVDSIP